MDRKRIIDIGTIMLGSFVIVMSYPQFCPSHILCFMCIFYVGIFPWDSSMGDLRDPKMEVR